MEQNMVDRSTQLFVVDAAKNAAKNSIGDPTVGDVRDKFVRLTEGVDRIDPDVFDEAIDAAANSNRIHITHNEGRDKVQVLE